VKQTALNIDFAPTIAELGGISTPDFVDGRSLTPLLSDTPPATWHSAFLLEHWNGGGGEPRQTPTYAAIRTGTDKYVEHTQGDEELYDLSSDPYELESLHASADPMLVESLRSRLEELKACAGKSCQGPKTSLSTGRLTSAEMHVNLTGKSLRKTSLLARPPSLE
jgi:N-acetylglucosamine-6-sulfatase